METDTGGKKAIAMFMAMLMVGMAFAACASIKATALDFVDTSSLTVPWTQDFTPLDSAWDSEGNHCIVVGNDTSGTQPSAWYYNDGASAWSPILEGSDPTIPAVNLVRNMDTGVTYNTIQSAIDAATALDTLHVWSGTYNENVVINKELVLEGNGSASTIIDGGSSITTVTITANGVSFSGFTVRNAAVGICLSRAETCTIEYNTVQDHEVGILLVGASNNIIKNNMIRDNEQGIRAASTLAEKSIIGVTESGGAQSYGAVFNMNQDGSDYGILHDFGYGSIDGYYPEWNKDLVSDGSFLYGGAQEGGYYDNGALFKVRPDGSEYSIIHHFRGGANGDQPNGKLLLLGTELFGVTRYGGLDFGTLYKINTDGSGFTILYSFQGGTQGANPYDGVIEVSGVLYGMTMYGGGGLGTAYRINTDGTGFMRIFSFTAATGTYPTGRLVWVPLMGHLCGMTSQGGSNGLGTIFYVTTSGSAGAAIYHFSGLTTGRYPWGSLILDTGGTYLYGMASQGGANNLGTIFRIDAGGSNFLLLRSLANADGTYPQGSLLQVGNQLYGLTNSGGMFGYGTAFTIRKDGTGGFTVLKHFDSSANPQDNRGSFITDGSWLYSLSYGGGSQGVGTVFRMSYDGSTLQVLHEFSMESANGVYPSGGGVIQDGNRIYGVTYDGGMWSAGTIYRANIDGTGFTVLYDFSLSPGAARPIASLLMDGDYLYGTTERGGAHDEGTVFRINKDGTDFHIIYEFTWNDATDGSSPTSALIQDANYLYGMTRIGGASGMGTIFRIDKTTHAFLQLHAFAGGATGGRYPYGDLTMVGSLLYGMTYQGGTSNTGAIFRIGTNGAGFQVVYSMTNTNGIYPYGTMALEGTTLYGITSRGGANDLGTIFLFDTGSLTFIRLWSMRTVDGGLSRSSLILDGNQLYGMGTNGGAYGHGAVFRIGTDGSSMTVLHDFAAFPGDAQDPYMNELALIQTPASDSASNQIYRNNFIGNIVHAQDDSGPNSWNNGLPIGGNHWGGFTATDIEPDGIGDDPYPVPGSAGAFDGLPWLSQDRWALPYTTFLNIARDDVNRRFWICGEYGPGVLTSLYYIPYDSPTTMVPIIGPSTTFTAVAADELGNILLGGNNYEFLIYYRPVEKDGFFLVESLTSKMFGWNITDITYNMNDNRFYIVGNVMNQDRGVAFVTDPGPFISSAHCYLDTSDLLNTPGIGALRSIEWNPNRNYALAVGDGVYRLNQYDGNAMHELTWSTIGTAQTGISYNDISWDSDGWNEAGIVGVEAGKAKYWRYYHTNPALTDGYMEAVGGSAYHTCAMKPPSSPKWLIVPHSGGCPRMNIQELDESKTVTFSSSRPHMFTVSLWKQADVLRSELLDSQVDAGSTFTFFIEANYTSEGIDLWADLDISFSAWFDNGFTGMNTQPGDPTWTNNNYRTRQFNVTYSASTGIPTMSYPTMVPGVEEFAIHSYWADPAPHGADGFTHLVYINITFGPQTWAADGGGLSNPNAGAWDRNLALNDAGSWDLKVHMYNPLDPVVYNLTYQEFGIKEYGAVSSTGNPTGSAPPGTIDYQLGPNCIVHYSANTPYYLTVSIPDLHMNGDVDIPNPIPAGNIQVRNPHSLATGLNSDINLITFFAAPGTPLHIWGVTGTPLSAPVHGTQSAGPYSDYSAAVIPEPFEVTEISWWIDVPVSVAQGTYRGTITLTITD
jgi:uncharacterized repeat protein (TIGR03803 family)/parallel beta-helix repeat protein